jgi:hypothetical protein
MANQQDLNQNKTNTFIKGLNKDSDSSFIQEGMWTHARNAVNNTAEGDTGTLSNESSNILCAVTGPNLNGVKHIVGAIHLYSDKWVIFTADHGPNDTNESVTSEIGLFEEDVCRYRPIVRQKCLELNKWDLVTGAAREKEDCSWGVYWADGKNPDRYMNIGDPNTWPPETYTWQGNNTYASPAGDIVQWPGVTWVQDCEDSNGTAPGGCITCTDTQTLNCDRIRLARLMKTPCAQISLGKSGGNLRNGSYFVVIAYAIKGIKVTDWFSPSNIQPLWFENEPSGSIEIDIEADKESFDEFILAVVSTVNQDTVAKQVGIYSTNTTRITLDQIREDLIAIPIAEIPIRNSVFEKSDQMVEVNNYLLRVGPTGRFDFNYQPLANLIQANWVSVEYPEDYYIKGGHKTSYLRDEVYAFFIRWVYDTGDKSSSYHIPGRAAENFIIPTTGVSLSETAPLTGNLNNLDSTERVFEVYNTASQNPPAPPQPEFLDDGGKVLARGRMAYWESTEYYPDKNPDVWNSSSQCWTGVSGTSPAYDLCGTPIRHHKFPDNDITSNTFHFGIDPTNFQSTIRIMGVEFSNIIFPKDNDGNDILGIVGYEILRGSREGNRSIIAKGMINNLRPYNILPPSLAGETVSVKGYYPNHPFNTIKPLEVTDYNDPFIQVVDEDDENVNIQLEDIPRDIVTFHSPDTNFRTPFLSPPELKLYGYLGGSSNQRFVEPNQHPLNKLLNNVVQTPVLVAGILAAVISRVGKRTINQPAGGFQKQVYPNTTGAASGTVTTAAWSSQANAVSQMVGLFSGSSVFSATVNAYLNSGAFLIEGASGANTFNNLFTGYDRSLGALNAGIYTAPTAGMELSDSNYLGDGLWLTNALYYFAEGMDTALKLIYALVPYRQYALQMQAYGFYKRFFQHPSNEQQRFNIEDSFYLNQDILDMKPYMDGTTNVQPRINNLNRQNAVVVRTETGTGPFFINGSYEDQSLVTLGTAIDANLADNLGYSNKKKSNPFSTTISSHYAGLKLRIRNQYGQLDTSAGTSGIKQITITPCEVKFDPNTLSTQGPVCSNPGVDQKILPPSGPLFNGDTYINRYTEKNVMLFFYDWLFGQPDGTEYNYFIRQMIPQPKYWMNSERYDVTDFSIQNLVQQIFSGGLPGTGFFPSDFYSLDQSPVNLGYGVNRSYFYLANCSVRDFFVESEVIVDFRIDGDTAGDKAYRYNKYTNLPAMFDMNPDVITAGNYYSYDYSLSVSKLITQYYSQGNLQSRYYDPNISALCYKYYPDRILYSLQQGAFVNTNDASAKDSWFIYLANNYVEFKDQISGVKNFAKTGIFITFKNSSPLVYQGSDTLETDAGTKLTIGDGGLFLQTPQSIVLADSAFEYGSCQDSRSVISTPAGLFYVSQNQGKVFSYGTGLTEISQLGMKWWFNIFLPYKLLDTFPDYPNVDNPVAGIGCQIIYDNLNSIIYVSKRDFKVSDAFAGLIEYDRNENEFYVNTQAIKRVRIRLGEAPYFEDASWTASYDPKLSFWISFHDWHPNLVIPSKRTFITAKNGSLWRHNDNCTSYCNYYNIDYPFEIEVPMPGGQTVTTTRSMEYMLECYRRSAFNCVDQYHVLDFNFDQAIVYNSEQVSGYLNLNIFPKNNVTLSLAYPQINLNSIDILFAKEENKYRFNQFWDITRDRGEFPVGSNYPPTGPLIPGTTVLQGPYTQQNIWITSANGYERELNSANLDYTKAQLQRKKFRHYLNFLSLSRSVSNDVNMIFKISNSKQVYSPR